MSKRGEDYDLWQSLVLSADKETIAPGFSFGKYVHPTQPRSVMRKSPEGQMTLLNMSHGTRGRSREKGSLVAPFVAWDGEGITSNPAMPQDYVLFGSSTGHYVQGEALSTEDCLQTIIQCEMANLNAIHIGFAFKYDSEMILRDLPLRHWYVMRAQGVVRYQDYLISYHPGRMFRVTQKVDGQNVTATIYDVWGFFQGSFIKALTTWLDASELESIRQIEVGKDARGTFTYDQIDDFIRPYWSEELRLLVVLGDRLRERLSSAEICPSQWHGAGAVATTVYRKHSTRQHQSRTERDWTLRDADLTTVLPEEVNEASRHAYAGGRFELFRMGHTDEKVYQYDINSAYPAGIALLPSLKGCEWEFVENPKYSPNLFALWRIEYSRWGNGEMYRAGPLPQREWTGRVAYPSNVNGWYWTPEASLVARSKYANLTGAWICHHNGEYPFAWVRELYDERRARKANGDPSEKAYKLALNSLYGKMAQRLGWQPPNGSLPRFHQLEWAGWVTSFTRMRLYDAIRQAGSDLVSCETDAVFTTRPLLDLPTGSALGEWEVTEHEWITYLQSGTYWSNNGAKYRGFDRDSLSHEDAMQWLRTGDFAAPLIGSTTRFIGAGIGLGTPNHRRWITENRDMQPGRSGKRVHVAEICLPCADGIPISTHMHPLACISKGGQSFPHSLPWLEPFEPDVWQEMSDLENWDALE